MTIGMRLVPVNRQARDIVIALVLGAAGFLLNMLEFQLGWGLHFIFGNALIFAFIRALRPQSLMLAASVSSLRSVFLWKHPWAWLIWTIEAGFIAYLSRKKASPVRVDVLFWVLIGTPLLIISYGMVMDMDRLSLLLVIAKQATNGVLNVVLGEIIYLAALSLKAPGQRSDWPKMPIESFLMSLLLAIILIPTTAYLYIDAPSREQAARARVEDALQKRLQITGAIVGTWVQSRADVLGMFVDGQLAFSKAGADGLPESLGREFAGASVVDKTGATLWATASSGIPHSALQKLASEYAGSGKRVHLAAIRGDGKTSEQRPVLVIPFEAIGRPAAIIAPLRQGALQRLLSETDGQAAQDTFLTHDFAHFLPLSQADPASVRNLQGIPESVRRSALNSNLVISNVAYGNAIMSDLRDARMVRASAVAGLPDWAVFSVSSLAPEVLKGREGQLHLFTALCTFALLVALFASFLSKRTELSFRQLAQSAADLAVLGTRREKIDSLVVAELNEISGKIASAGSTVSRERGALASYQRRLDSIAKHAPIIVYALDVRDHKKAELTYVSEALETILGYSRGEAATAGWWSHAIHPEDYDRCLAVFGNLQAGRVVEAEYRLRHKLGHYVWVYDTLAVEANSAPGQCEAVGVVIDISDRKAAAEQLMQADKMASLGRMISGTAHELNQPLNFIKVAATNLREHARRGRLDADRFIARLDNILSHVNRASAIILQMRVFGRIPRETPSPVDLKATVDAVLTMVTPQLELDGTRVDTSECGSGVKVRALAILLEQVFLNLILNANDAIRARHNAGDPKEGCIKVSVARREWLARVTIEDNGIGLSSDILPLIFEPFFTTKLPKEGTGLGLSISYGIVRDLGGTIRAENTPQGARFTIDLPLAE